MAQRVKIILEDDYDGGSADETVTFSLDGADYEIDLSDNNASALREAFAPWVGNARKTGGRKRRSSTSGSTKSADGSVTSEIRAWAQSRGMGVSSRGRVSSEVREAYEKAHA